MKQRKIGVMISEIPFANLPLLFKQQGMDFVIIDCEHGGFDYKDVASMIMNGRLSSILTFVRIPNNERKDIQKFLDMGADGLILPMTNNSADIDKVIEYAKYSPLGKRGISTMRAHSLYNPGEITEYMKQENDRVKVFAQIETIDGVKNIDEILSLNCLEGVFVGPNDLSCDYDCLNDNDATQIHEAMISVAKTALKYNKKAGIISSNENYLKTAKENDFEFYSIGSELSYLKSEAVRTVKKANNQF